MGYGCPARIVGHNGRIAGQNAWYELERRVIKVAGDSDARGVLYHECFGDEMPKGLIPARRLREMNAQGGFNGPIFRLSLPTVAEQGAAVEMIDAAGRNLAYSVIGFAVQSGGGGSPSQFCPMLL